MGGFGAYLLCILAGFAALRAAWPAPGRWSAHDPLRLALAPTLGLGLLSLVVFSVRTVLNLPGTLVIAAFALLTVALVAGALWQSRSASPETWTPRKAPTWLFFVFFAIAATALATITLTLLAAPHGEWDAWSIWNLRARFLYLSADPRAPFSSLIEWAHPDYPLLVPAAVAGLWTWNGGESTSLVALVSVTFWCSIVAVPVLLLARLRSNLLAVTAGIAIAATPLLSRNAGALYADVPVAYLFVTALGLGLLALQSPAARSLVFLAGLHAGLAAWTKNEGLMFCGVFTLTFCLSVRTRAELTERLRLLLPLLAGMALILAFVGHFKYHFAPANDLIAVGKSTSITARLTDFSRYSMTFWGIVEGLLTFGGWLVPPFLVFGVWLALQRLRPLTAGSILWPFAAASVQLLGYLLVYVAGSERLDWQLETSVERLLMQIWPSAVLALMMLARDE
jgi:hypothetical protein